MLQIFSKKNEELKMLDPLKFIFMYNSKTLSKIIFYSFMFENRPTCNVYFGQIES